MGKNKNKKWNKQDQYEEQEEQLEYGQQSHYGQFSAARGRGRGSLGSRGGFMAPSYTQGQGQFMRSQGSRPTMGFTQSSFLNESGPSSYMYNPRRPGLLGASPLSGGRGAYPFAESEQFEAADVAYPRGPGGLSRPYQQGPGGTSKLYQQVPSQSETAGPAGNQQAVSQPGFGESEDSIEEVIIQPSKSTRPEVCIVCERRVPNMLSHANVRHLPWFVYAPSACSICFMQCNDRRQQKLHWQNAHPEEDTRMMPEMWRGCMKEFMSVIAERLGLELTDLPIYVNDNGLGNNNKQAMNPADKPYYDDPDFSHLPEFNPVNPRNLRDCSHWRIILRLIARTGGETGNHLIRSIFPKDGYVFLPQVGKSKDETKGTVKRPYPEEEESQAAKVNSDKLVTNLQQAIENGQLDPSLLPASIGSMVADLVKDKQVAEKKTKNNPPSKGGYCDNQPIQHMDKRMAIARGATPAVSNGSGNAFVPQPTPQNPSAGPTRPGTAMDQGFAPTITNIAQPATQPWIDTTSGDSAQAAFKEEPKPQQAATNFVLPPEIEEKLKTLSQGMAVLTEAVMHLSQK